MRTIENTLRYIVLAGVFALPFIVFLVTTSLFFPFITGKNFAFRFIVEIITVAWLALMLVNTQYRPRRSWVLAAFAVFVVVVAAADAFGVVPFKSFWSNFERMDGWITQAHLFAYFVVALAVVNTDKLWHRLWHTSLGVSVVVGLYGLLQLAGVQALGQGGGAGLTARLDATFGNPIYLAAYMLFHVFIAAMLWAQSWTDVKRSRWTTSIGYGGIIVLDTLILCLTGTRGTIIGLIGGTLISALLLVVLARESRNAWRMSVAALVGLIVIGGGFWMVRDASWIKSVGFLNRLSTISAQDQTIKARFLNWQIAWHGVEERPFLGWGQENYAVVFDKYYDPRMYAQEQWFDRTHNIIFDWLIAAGFIGLLSYLSISIAALWAVWRSGAFSIPERAIISGLFAGYFFHNLFVFDNITSYLLFVTVLAYVAWRASEAWHTPRLFESFKLPSSATPYVAIAAVPVVWVLAWGVNADALAQNRALLAALAQQGGSLQANLDLLKKAIAYKSVGTQEVREQLAQMTTQVLSSANVPNEVKQAYYTTATTEMLAQSADSPLDARFPLFLGVLLDSAGDYVNGQKALERAHQLSLKKQSIIYEQAANAQAQGDNEKTVAYFKAAYELDTTNTQAQILYAAALIHVGHDAEADALLAPLVVTGEAADTHVAAAYAARNRYDKIATIWAARVAAQPTDAQAYFTLAAAYTASGQKLLALDILEKAKVAVPAIASQADSFETQIKNGTAKVK